MFCQKCGEPLGAGAQFCSHCGAAAVAVAEPTLSYAPTAADRVADDRPILTLRPRFIGWKTVLPVIPIQLFMTVWAGGFCGGFSTAGVMGLKKLGLVGRVPGWFPFVFFACAAFFGIPALVYFRTRFSYAKTEYRFYADRLEYYQGFFNTDQKTVMYRDVRQVELRRGFVQRRYGLGTVFLNTAVQVGARGAGGISVADIDDSEDTYQRVKQLVQTAR